MPIPKLSLDFCEPSRLSSLRDFLLSSLGPGGSAKAFVNSGGHLSLAATSQRVLRCLDIDDPCCEAVLSSVRSFLSASGGGGGGLYLGALTCELIRLLRPLSPAQADRCAAELRAILSHCFTASRRRLDWSRSVDMVSLVQSVLTSKAWISVDESRSLAVSLIKGFLDTLPEGESSVKSHRLRVKVVHGRGDRPRLVKGFLHRCGGDEKLFVRIFLQFLFICLFCTGVLTWKTPGVPCLASPSRREPWP